MLKFRLLITLFAITCVRALPCWAQYAENPAAQIPASSGATGGGDALELRGIESPNAPNSAASPYQVVPNSNTSVSTKGTKKHKHSTIGTTVGMPGEAAKGTFGAADKTAKVGAGMTDRAAKTGVGLTDRAVKTSIGAPYKGVKEIFKAIF